MTTQMIAEAKVPYDKATQGAKSKPQFLIHEEKPPKNEIMKDRGGGFDESQQPPNSNTTNRNRNDDDDDGNQTIVVTELTDLLMPWEMSEKKENAAVTPTTPSNNPTANVYHPAS